jgi:RNA polymerase sigma-70 factor, ECF subfamily
MGKGRILLPSMLDSPDTLSTSDAPWKACYAELAPRLLLYARQWTRTAADAEDAVQTGFIRFWRAHPDAEREHYPLLYAAVRTAALDLLRGEGRRARREAEYHVEHEGEPYFDPAIEQREDAEAIEAALRRLPPEQREVLVLRVWGELTFAEIARSLGESINTVAARHRYALEALRRILKPHAHERV